MRILYATCICILSAIILVLYAIYEAPVAQWVERLTANPTTPAGLWFDPQSERIFFRASCPPSSDV